LSEKVPIVNQLLNKSIIGVPTAINNTLQFDSVNNVFIWVAAGGGGGEANTSSNSGAGAGLAQAKVGVNLPFKSLIGELNKIVIAANANDLTFTIGTDIVNLIAAQSLSNKTLVSPIIANFINANHNHQAAAGGGTLVAAALSDFAAAVTAVAAVVANTAKISYTDAAAVALNTAKLTNAVHTGDATGGGALTIAPDAVTYAKMQNVVANNRILGNIAGAGGIVTELTPAQLNLILPIFTNTLNGLAPLSGGGTTKFLRADGTWVVPAGSGGSNFTDRIPLVMEVSEGIVAFPDIHELVTAGAKVSGWVLPDGASASKINFKCNVPNDLASTPAASIKFIIMTQAAQTDKDVRLTVSSLAVADTENLDQAFAAETETTVRMPNAIETKDIYDQDLTTDPVAGDTLLVQLNRDPVDALDNYIGNILIIGAYLEIDRTAT